MFLESSDEEEEHAPRAPAEAPARDIFRMPQELQKFWLPFNPKEAGERRTAQPECNDGDALDATGNL
jgi:hypothetical protein